MGGYMIPLEGQRAPQQNPYQAAMQGEEYAQQLRASNLGQQLTQQQIQSAQTGNQVQDIQLQDLQRQQRDREIMRDALSQIYAPNHGQQPAAVPEPEQPSFMVPASAPTPVAQYMGAESLPPKPAGYVPPRPIVPAQAPQAAPGSGPAGLDRMQSVIDYMTQHGASPDFVSNISQGVLKTREAYAQAAKEQNALQVQLHTGQNALLQGTFSHVNQDGTRQWEDASPQTWNAFLQRAVQQNLLQPGDLAAIQQAHPDGAPPTKDELQHYSSTLEMAKDFASQGLVEAQTREAIAKQKADEIKNAQAIRDDAASRLGAQETYGDYQNLRADLTKAHPELAGTFARFADRDPEAPMSDEDKRLVQNAGQTAQQQAQTAEMKQRLDEQKLYQEGLLAARGDQTAIRRQMLDNQRELIEMRKQMAGQTANSQAVNVRQGRSEYLKTNTQEGILQRQRLAIAGAMANQEKTGQVALDKNQEPRDLQAELDQVTDQLEETIVAKHDAAQRAGLTPPLGLDKELTKIGRPPARPNLGPVVVLPGQPGPAKPPLPAGLQNAPAAPAAPTSAAPAPQAPPAKPTAAPPPPAQGGPKIGDRASNGKITVRWDGANWIDEATNKPAKF